MRIGILVIGETDMDLVTKIKEDLETLLTETEVALTTKTIPLTIDSFNESREQYRADTILNLIHNYAEQTRFDKVLGIADVDLFIPRLNFVFGEAECPGKAALISIWRLRPEFYKKAPNIEILIERGTKEAMHELGHTVGLRHCTNPYCVMYFSNSIFETDRKQNLFCNKCFLKTQSFPDLLR